MMMMMTMTTMMMMMMEHSRFCSIQNLINGEHQVDPGFFLEGGAPPRNDVTDGEVKKI